MRGRGLGVSPQSIHKGMLSSDLVRLMELFRLAISPLIKSKYHHYSCRIQPSWNTRRLSTPLFPLLHPPSLSRVRRLASAVTAAALTPW